MSRMPKATWRPILHNFTTGGQTRMQGLVVHIMAGTLAGTDSWFRNSKAQASSHFGTGKKGELYQWVDTKDRAWAQASGNGTWLSIENEGHGGDALTPQQVQRIADVLRWAHDVHGVPLQVTKSPAGRGLGYHAMGGEAWGGHSSCPGAKIIAQLPEIVALARKGTEKPPAASTVPAFPGRGAFVVGQRNNAVNDLDKQLVRLRFTKHHAGSAYTPGPLFSENTRRNIADFQRSHPDLRSDPDGYPGPLTWKLLHILKGR